MKFLILSMLNGFWILYMGLHSRRTPTWTFAMALWVPLILVLAWKIIAMFRWRDRMREKGWNISISQLVWDNRLVKASTAMTAMSKEDYLMLPETSPYPELEALLHSIALATPEPSEEEIVRKQARIRTANVLVGIIAVSVIGYCGYRVVAMTMRWEPW